MTQPYKFNVTNLNLYYGDFHALKNVNMQLEDKVVTSFIGPSGCGKSTFLKTLNRMQDLVPSARVEGLIELDGKNIYSKNYDVTQLRKQVGMVFQQPNPFPKSIYDNIAYGPRTHGIKDSQVPKAAGHGRDHAGSGPDPHSVRTGSGSRRCSPPRYPRVGRPAAPD